MTRILIIDDDKLVLDMLGQTLERAGYNVMMATNGGEGINMFQENPADLIITDLVMPHKEGLETIMELRKKFPDIKIIAISGGGRIDPDEYLRIAKKFGAQRTFTKPIDKDELLLAIEELLA